MIDYMHKGVKKKANCNGFYLLTTASLVNFSVCLVNILGEN